MFVCQWTCPLFTGGQLNRKQTTVSLLIWKQYHCYSWSGQIHFHPGYLWRLQRPLPFLSIQCWLRHSLWGCLICSCLWNICPCLCCKCTRVHLFLDLLCACRTTSYHFMCWSFLHEYQQDIPTATLREQLLRRKINPRLFCRLTVILRCFVLFRWFKFNLNSNSIPIWAAWKDIGPSNWILCELLYRHLINQWLEKHVLELEGKQKLSHKDEVAIKGYIKRLENLDADFKVYYCSVVDLVRRTRESCWKNKPS